MHTIISPLHIIKNQKGDTWSLNLNQYRNTHFRILNQYKIKYKLMMKNAVMGLPKLDKPIVITYTIYPKTRRLFDVANVGSVIDKFFSDCLVELGKLEDDNYKWIPKIVYQFGEVDKAYPRCEITIQEISNAN